jgi:putative transposase
LAGRNQQRPKTVLETALDGEMTDPLGYEKRDPADVMAAIPATGSGLRTVLTQIGLVQIEVPATGTPPLTR